MRRGQGAVPGAGIDGERLRERRAELGLTQAELARRSGISQEAISRIENGRIRGLMQPTQDALARALETSVGWLRGAPDAAASSRGEAAPELVLVADEDDPLMRACGLAFDPARHLLSDTYAVLSALKETDRRLVDGDLVVAARRWLDVAASLRREGIEVSTRNLLMRLTLGVSAREREGAAMRAAEWQAEAEAEASRQGVERASTKASKRRR